MNKHPRDSLIIFDSTKHNYTCNNLVGFTSVTGWVKTHFKHFDANATVDKIMRILMSLNSDLLLLS